MTKKQFAEGYPKTYSVFERSKSLRNNLYPFYKRITDFIDCELGISCQVIETEIEGKQKRKYAVQIFKDGKVLDSYENLFDSFEAAEKSVAAMAVKYVEYKILCK